MGVRKNAKFLDATERESFVKACVLMEADIVNPGAPAANRYGKWDELVAIDRTPYVPIFGRSYLQVFPSK